MITQDVSKPPDNWPPGFLLKRLAPSTNYSHSLQSICRYRTTWKWWWLELPCQQCGCRCGLYLPSLWLKLKPLLCRTQWWFRKDRSCIDCGTLVLPVSLKFRWEFHFRSTGRIFCQCREQSYSKAQPLRSNLLFRDSFILILDKQSRESFKRLDKTLFQKVCTMMHGSPQVFSVGPMAEQQNHWPIPQLHITRF